MATVRDAPEAPVEAGQSPAGRPRLLVPVVAGVAIGVDALVTALVLVPVPGVLADDLTQNGAHNFRPEHDAAAYLASGVVAVVAVLLLSSWGRESRPVAGRWARWLPLPVASGALVVATAMFVAFRDDAPLGAGAGLAYLAVSIALAGASVLAAWVVPAGAPAAPWGAPLDVPAGRRRVGPADLVVPALVVALLYVPAWRELAGNAFAGEGSLHLDFFGLGPALAFKSGLALGGEVHPYYGVGWAMVFARLDLLSYGHLIRFEVLYGCLYFTGVYALVRVLTGDRRWAAAGTALAVLLQLFAGFPGAFVLWRFPSASVMRWPFDVWFFLACLLQLRSRRPVWGVVAGALVALTVVFQTETGLALGLAFAFWWAARWRAEGTAGLRSFPAAVAVAASIVVLGLGIAGRWTLLTGAFWRGWLENVRLGSRGATLLPVVGVESSAVVVAFVAVTATYVAFVAFAVVQVARREATPATVMLGCVALYGFVTFLYFVGRSNPHNLFRPTVPLAVLVASAAGLAHRAWVESAAPGRRAALVPWCAVAVAVGALVADPGARTYPGLLRAAVTDDAPPGVCLLESPRDVCGLPPATGALVGDLRDLASRLRELGSEGAPVAVIDQIGPVIPYMAGARSWGRYSPLFPTLFTREQREEALVELEERPPPLLVMRTFAGVDAFYADSWRAFRPTVERDFVLDSVRGVFEIWERRTPPPPRA